MNNQVIDIIIAFISAMNSKENAVVSYYNDKSYKIYSPKYLLGQIIRQYAVQTKHFYLSASAQSLWSKISQDDIWGYSYRDYVKCENEQSVTIYEYRGNESKPFSIRDIAAGDGFVFNNVFHDEHMIPVNTIIDELTKLKKPDYDNVIEILDSIYICRILKSEDKLIPRKWKRPFDITAVFEMYNEAGITITERSDNNDC